MSVCAFVCVSACARVCVSVQERGTPARSAMFFTEGVFKDYTSPSAGGFKGEGGERALNPRPGSLSARLQLYFTQRPPFV